MDLCQKPALCSNPRARPTGWPYRWRPSAVALAVVLIHGFVVVALLQQRFMLVGTQPPLVVSLVEGPKRDLPVNLPLPELAAPVKAHLLFQAPPPVVIPEVADSSTAVVAAVQATASAETGAVTPLPATDPVLLTEELDVFCPSRAPPAYPPQAKRLREQGEVTLRVELDERGRIAGVTIVKGSGFALLDEAASAAVLGWRCSAAMLHGRPTRAIATQSLEFVLQRR